MYFSLYCIVKYCIVLSRHNVVYFLYCIFVCFLPMWRINVFIPITAPFYALWKTQHEFCCITAFERSHRHTIKTRRQHFRCTLLTNNKLCAWWHDMPRPSPPPVGAQGPRSPPSRRNVAVVSHPQYVLTVTSASASRVKAAVSKASWRPWPLTFWPWKWCPSHVWRGLPLCQFWSLCSRFRPDVRDRQTDVRCQTKASLNALAY